MKIYGHPWSINSRKTLLVFAEKGVNPDFSLVMVPKGEHKLPEHIALHPFGKVPVLDDGGFVLYETRAINQYLDRSLPGTSLTPRSVREGARMEQWLNVADSYFVPHVHPFLVESLFRRYLGGEQNQEVIRSGHEKMQFALDVLESALTSSDYLAGSTFSLADIFCMPYLEYLHQLDEDEKGKSVSRRPRVASWWQRISSRPSWQKVARTGPQPYEPGMTADVVEKLYR